MLPANSWTWSIDLQDADWHVPVAPHFCQNLGFLLGADTISLTNWSPFGLNIAPRVSTNLVIIIVTTLKQQGVDVIAYLDNRLL